MTDQRRPKSPESPSHQPSRHEVEGRAAPAASEHEIIARPDPEGIPTVGSEELWSKKIHAIEEIDRGGMSYVARGVDRTLKRDLALKVSPLPRKQMPRAQLARFLEEAQITAQLEHPNVVPVHELGLDPQGRAYFSMKLVHGQSLETVLEKLHDGDPETVSEFGLRRLLDVFLQVCQAIEYAHARGVIHRDLKPSNIMVGDFGEVLVMDWGVAKLMNGGDLAAGKAVAISAEEANLPEVRESVPPPNPRVSVTSLRAGKEALATQAGTLIGTPAYMSPEQARGEAVDERTDLYALGVMLYEILCGQLPFDEEDPTQLLLRMLREKPVPPSSINPQTPLALEALALRLLEKDPDRRSLEISEIRAHIQDYIEGIARDYKSVSLWTNLLWTVGGLSLFAFLVWYLTGESIAALFVLAPATVFNAVGWFLFVLALGVPLWSVYLALRPRGDRDRFAPPSADERFIGRYLAHRTLSAAVAPVFQLIFIGKIASFAIGMIRAGHATSAEVVQRVTTELRAQWGQSLIVILVFLFCYLFFLSSEARFSRRIDRYDDLVARSRWEAVWPFFLILLLLLTIGATSVLDWALARRGDLRSFVHYFITAQPLDLVDIGKTLVFQGTFLAALVLLTVLLSFPLPEVLAALRLPYQPADQAAVEHRARYFARSLAVLRVARVAWLYGGAMIGVLTAMTVLSDPSSLALVKEVAYILAPSLVGFVGYAVTRRRLSHFLRQAPAVEQLLARQIRTSRLELRRVVAQRLRQAPWRHRLLQLVVPFVCVAAYLIWTGSGIHRRAIRHLVMPVSAQGWLLILPYVALVPLLLIRDPLQALWLERKSKEQPLPAPMDL